MSGDPFSKVDWAALGSSDVPDWMRDLLSGNANLRRDAFHNLIYHFAPYDCADCLAGCDEKDRLEVMSRESTFWLIPILIDLLRVESDDTKVSILALMHGMLSWRHTEACLSEEAIVQVFRLYMTRCRDAFSNGIDIYRQLTHSASNWVREEAQLVLENLDP